MLKALAAAWLLWYGYNGPAAADAFAAIHAAEPSNAEALLGEVLALGPDLNTPQRAERFERAQRVLHEADALRKGMTPPQTALLDALHLRYTGAPIDTAKDDEAYRRAVAAASDRYSTDETLALAAAEAIAEDNEDPAARRFIDRAQSIDPQNIMAAHLCVHEKPVADTISCANVLDAHSFTPATEHLAHMSAHTWIQTGAYEQAVDASERAWLLIEALPADDPHRTQYEPHDLYVGYSAAMMTESYETAQRWAKRAEALGDTNAAALTALRFGRSQDIDEAALARPRIAAFIAARKGKTAQLHALIAQFSGATSDTQFLLEARAQEAAGNAPAAEADYAKAIANQHKRFTGELIPLWPAEAARGGFLLRAHRWNDAVSAFQADLRRYPNDPRAVRGLQLATQARDAASTVTPDGAEDL